jgi:hypothetical protein
MILSENELIGKKLTITIPVCRIDVGWNKKKGINNVYAAPAGWQILEFTPKEISKRQKAAYSFDLAPSNFSFSSTTIIDTKFDELLDLAIENGKEEKYAAKIKQMRSDYEKYYKRIIASHSSITTTGSVQGDNNTFKRYPGRLYLDLEVTIIYLPVNEAQFFDAIETLKSLILEDSF